MYKYIPSGETIQVNPKQEFTNDVQENINEQFYNASDVYTIQEETALASNVYQNVDVRINYVINTNTGERVGDDFKTLLFKQLNHSVDLGRMYQFDSNYWLCVNVDKLKTLVATAQVRRCNNVLRWQDVSGAIYEVPCFLSYLIKENRDYSTAGSAIVVPSGMIDCTIQFNSMSNKIRPNQRFLIGNQNNWTAYRVEGGGINNFNNLTTINNMSSGIIKFSLAVDYINIETDDIINGIANVTENLYALTLNQASISGNPTQTVQLVATVTLNGGSVSRNLVWSSDDTDIATVSSSGLVTFVAEGEAVIRCQLENNDGVFDSCDVEITSTPVNNYQLIVSPSLNYVFKDEETTWSVYLYENGVQQADVVSFVLDANTVPSTSYIYEVLTPNTFKIHNYEMFLTDTLDVTCTSGIYSTIISITLRGAW